MMNSPFGGAHQDVLGQKPSDPESKASLVAEIKDRARKAFARKDMPVCEALYTKAIETLPDAPLYSNRSAVRLTLGKFDAAGRVGGDGLGARRAEKFKLKPKKKVDVAPKIEAFVKPAPIGDKTKSAAPAAGGKSDMRGYKIDSQGRKTTFFNNELSDEAKALIGDIAPKKVEAPVSMATKAGESSWNQAGTFESKDHKWAKAWLEDKFADFMVDLPDRQVGAVSVPCFLTVKVLRLQGRRVDGPGPGKKKWVFDASFKLDWEFALDDKGSVAKGSVAFPDVSGDVIDEGDALEYALEVDSSRPTAPALITSHIKSETAGLRPAVRGVVADLVAEFRATK
ncbi:hypothetical protein JL722_261 [Aureococcus anophagefferens]|nr:hypothetical protein JL722_261 [Aureococcus anophagefferens]